MKNKLFNNSELYPKIFVKYRKIKIVLKIVNQIDLRGPILMLLKHKVRKAYDWRGTPLFGQF